MKVAARAAATSPLSAPSSAGPTVPGGLTVPQPSSRLARDSQLQRQIRFCGTPAGVRVAYATVGRGPALLVPAAWISHLELWWQDPAYRALFAPLTGVRTVVQYDRPGCGLSESWPGRQTLGTELEVLQAVADHLELDRLDLLGASMGAPVALAFAAAHPCTASKLVTECLTWGFMGLATPPGSTR